MEKDNPPDGANTTASSDTGSNNTPGSQASQTTMPPRRRLFTITAKGKEKARRKLKEIQDAKAKYDEDSENSIHSSGLGHDDLVKAPDHANMMSGFSTARGNQIIVSDEAIKAARAKLCDENLDEAPEHANMMSGFSTARGNQIAVSDKAIKAARAKLCDEDLLEIPERANTMSGFTTASRKNINVSDEALQAARAKFCDEDFDEASERTNVMCGFTTASKKKISVSDEALQAARAKFCDEDFDEDDVPNEISGFSTAGGKKITVSDDAIRAAKAKLCDQELLVNPGEHPNMMSGFTTASKKKISVSDEALQAARAKFCDEDFDEAPEDANMMSGFSTASKKKITVSDEALQAARAKFCDVAFDEAPELATMMSGFSTASRKKITVSEEALQAARAKFCDEDFDEAPELANMMSGFSTASNKKISVSDEALQAAKAKFCVEHFDEASELTNVMSGFATASRKKISVSDEALQAAKAKFSGEDHDETPERAIMMTDLSTAGGNQITVSDEAINAAKELIQLDDSNEVVKAGAVNATCLPEAGVHKNAVSEDDLAADKNAMVFENQNEIVVLMTDQDCSLSKVEANSLELKGPSDGDETFCSDSDPEVAECTRILLEDIENSNDEAEWTSPTDSDHNKKPKYTLACIPSVGGDIIPSLQVLVVRVYSIMYCVLGKDNKNCFMTEKAFANRQMDKAAKEAELRESLIPGVEAEVRKQLIKKENINPKELTPRAVRSMSTDELLHILNNCEDDAETVGFVMIQLNPTAKTDLERARTELSESIQRAVAEAMVEKMKTTQPTEKVPSRVLKLRVMDEESCTNKSTTTSGVITIWNAQDEIINNIREGKVYDFEFLKPASFHSGQEIRLGSTKTTRISPVECDLVNENLFKRQLSVIPDVIAEGFNPPFGEFDTVGVVMKVEGFKEHIGQIVHLIEGNGVVLKVKFWNNIQDWDLQDILKPGKTIACLNLQWRLTSVENTMAFAQESSEFITNPKEEYLLNGFQKLSEEMETIKRIIWGEGQSSGETSSKQSPLVEEPVEVSGVATRNSAKRRYLERYGEPPELATLPVASPSKRGRISKKFVTPRRITPKK